jgi:hypothetical protein
VTFSSPPNDGDRGSGGFSKLTHFRRVATRDERSAASGASFGGGTAEIGANADWQFLYRAEL